MYLFRKTLSGVKKVIFILLISTKYYCYFQQGNTALHIAVIGNYKDLASSLVDAKAEIDLPNHVSFYRLCK